jgi:hypothetical protein
MEGGVGKRRNEETKNRSVASEHRSIRSINSFGVLWFKAAALNRALSQQRLYRIGNSASVVTAEDDATNVNNKKTNNENIIEFELF